MSVAIKDFKTREQYFKLIQNVIIQHLRDELYNPLFEKLHIKPRAINDLDVLRNALREGKIFYIDGGFKAVNKFGNTIARELERIGATYDRRQKMYRIQYDRLPKDLLVSVAEAQRLSQERVIFVDNFLKNFLGNIDDFVDNIAFTDEVITILDDANQQIKKNVKKINVLTPELDETQLREIAKSYTTNMQYYIKKWAEKDIPEFRKKVQQAVLEGYREDKVQKILEREYKIGADKAKFLAQNETSIMLAQYRKVTYQRMGFNKFKWVTIMDGKERKLHADLNGKICSFDNPPIIDKHTGQTGLPGETYNCLKGDTNIVTPFLHNRLYRRKFRGETVELITRMGSFEITPNHPILTDKGWVKAGMVNIGDNIAKISNETFFAGETHPYNAITTIEKFFSFYNVLFKSERVATTVKDFHGDIAVDNQVDVINIKSKLGDYLKSEISHCRINHILTKANDIFASCPCNSAFCEAFPVGAFSPDSIISGLNKAFSFFFGSEFHSVEHSFTPIAWLDTLVYEMSGYSTSINSEFFCNLFDTPAIDKEFYSFLMWEICFNLFRKNIIAPLSHCSREMTCATSETIGDFSQRKPAFTEFDTIIDKRINKSFFHVYNLENKNNWYLANNYIIKNCRCGMIPYTDKL